MKRAQIPSSLGQSRSREESSTRQVDELRSIFMQNVSHKLRTPLGIIQGYAELLYDGELGALETEQVRALSIVVSRVRELRTMVERLGIIMAVEMHSAFLVRVNLAELTAQVIGENRVDADRAGIEMVVCLEPGVPSVLGDSCQLQQLVESLIENALKFTPGGGRIEVEVYAEPRWTCLTVTDTGVGIPEWELDRIFSGFYQTDDLSTCRYGGIGLGLTLVKAVAEEHGGRVEVDSQPGQGSRFLVRLPALRRDDQIERPVEGVATMRRVPVVGGEEYAALSLQELADGETFHD